MKGKRYFNYPMKYYATDLGLRNARLNFRQIEETHLMENAICNELVVRGCSVDVGAGALSPVTCQMLADITGRTIETIDGAQEIGAKGAAIMVAAGIQETYVGQLARKLVGANRVYTPNPQVKEVYERNYRVFKRLYKANDANFRALNGD